MYSKPASISVDGAPRSAFFFEAVKVKILNWYPPSCSNMYCRAFLIK